MKKKTTNTRFLLHSLCEVSRKIFDNNCPFPDVFLLLADFEHKLLWGSMELGTQEGVVFRFSSEFSVFLPPPIFQLPFLFSLFFQQFKDSNMKRIVLAALVNPLVAGGALEGGVAAPAVPFTHEAFSIFPPHGHQRMILQELLRGNR